MGKAIKGSTALSIQYLKVKYIQHMTRMVHCSFTQISLTIQRNYQNESLSYPKSFKIGSFTFRWSITKLRQFSCLHLPVIVFTKGKVSSRCLISQCLRQFNSNNVSILYIPNIPAQNPKMIILSILLVVVLPR